jgi:outer membrane protein assembly factor BamB
MNRVVTTTLSLLLCAMTARAQFGRSDWMTENADAQRSAWVKGDPKISPASVAQPGSLKLLWKLKLKSPPRQLHNLAAPATLELLIGYRGFRMLGFVQGSDGNLFTVDTDLGRLEWQKQLPSSTPAAAGTRACPGGTTTGVVRPVASAFSSGGMVFAFGRSQPAKSSVGAAGEGATTIKGATGRDFELPPPPAGSDKPRLGPPVISGGFPFGVASVIYALASDGTLHGMHLSGGQPYQQAFKFLPPGARANGLIVVDGMAYAVTINACGGAANGLWQLDFAEQKVVTWQGNIAGSAGAAFGGDGTIYVATGAGGGSPNAIVALDPKTMQTKAVYAAGQRAFATTPTVFQFKGKTLIAAAAQDGSVHLLDAANLSTALFVTPATNPRLAPTALASWQEANNGTRWLLAAHAGALPAGFSGTAKTGAILAWQVVEANGKIELQPAWASREVTAPLTPTVINGVVFATASGAFSTPDDKVAAAQRVARAGKAVLYALDGATGKELWNSGTTISSFTHGGALSGGMGQIYLTTHDGTLYAFGFSIEH